jgi:hypothetical protein
MENSMAKLGEYRDITGMRFGHLTAMEYGGRKVFPSGVTHNLWISKCDCGNTVTLAYGSLTSGHTTSCGCTAKQKIAEARTKHGYASHRKNGKFNKTYLCWRNMKSRCANPNDDRYPAYGGRGIKVCERWLVFENFLADMGDCPDNCSIERIDIDSDYCPSNCQWLPDRDQFENKQQTSQITHLGKTQSLKRWATELGLNYGTVYGRYQRGDTGEKLFRPV